MHHDIECTVRKYHWNAIFNPARTYEVIFKLDRTTEVRGRGRTMDRAWDGAVASAWLFGDIEIETPNPYPTQPTPNWLLRSHTWLFKTALMGRQLCPNCRQYLGDHSRTERRTINRDHLTQCAS